MAKNNEKRAEQWAEAKRRCRLSAEQLRRAREMGLNPLSLLKNIPAPTQQWKAPVGDWIDGLYEKRQHKTALKQAKRAASTKPKDASKPPPPPAAKAKSEAVKQPKPKKRPTFKLSNDPYHYRIHLSADLPMYAQEVDSFLLKYKVTLLGDIYAGDDDDLEPHYKRIGDLRVWLFLAGAYRDKTGYDLFDLFDADSEEAMQLFHAVFDRESGDINPALVQAGIADDLPVDSDVMHFQWGDLPTEYRRSDVVLAMVERAIDALGGGCFAATLWPWDAPAPNPDTNSSAEVLAFFDSQGGNEEHWGKIGFRRVPGTAILFRDLGLRGWDADTLMSGDYRSLHEQDSERNPDGDANEWL